MPLDPELMRGRIIKQEPDGSILYLPQEVTEKVELGVDRGARHGLIALAAAAGLGVAAEIVWQLNTLARGCLNENALWRLYGVPPVGMKTCAVEGFEWLAKFVESGMLLK